jgi:hypothetical protein
MKKIFTSSIILVFVLLFPLILVGQENIDSSEITIIIEAPDSFEYEVDLDINILVIDLIEELVLQLELNTLNNSNLMKYSLFDKNKNILLNSQKTLYEQGISSESILKLIQNSSKKKVYLFGSVNIQTEFFDSLNIKQDSKYTILPIGSNLFIISSEPLLGYYKVINLENGNEGFIHSCSITIISEVLPNQNEIFIKSEQKSSIPNKSEIEIYNNTSFKAILKLGNNSYIFSPKIIHTIFVEPQDYEYILTSDCCTPDFGDFKFEEGVKYELEIYIID